MSTFALPWPIVGRSAHLGLFDRVLSAGDQAGLLIHGPPGVGKTRLAEECRRRAAAQGHATLRIVGSTTTAGVPLAAVAGLLPGDLQEAGSDWTLDSVRLFEASQQTLLDRYGSGRVVLMADDLPLLDVASLAVISFLLAQGSIFLIGTVRASDTIPDLITSLWRDERLERVDLSDLGREDLDALLLHALGGPLEAASSRQLWTISQGNPLYARELVLGALDSGALVERAGVWHLERAPTSTGRLVDLLEERIGTLDVSGRSTLELLALCQPLDVDYVEASAGPGVLVALEEAGLIAVDLETQEVRLAHPLHGEVVRSGLPALRVRAILRAQADRLEATSTNPADQLRIAVWRLEANGRADSAVLIRGAQFARSSFDFRLVRRLLEAVPTSELDAESGLILGEAMYELGSFKQAEVALRQAQQLGSSSVVSLRLTLMRAKNLQWGLCRPDLALEVNGQARAQTSDPALLEELSADEAAIHMFAGRPEMALQVLAGTAATSARARVGRAISESPARATMGQTAEGIRVAQAGLDEHLAIADEPAIAHPGTHIVNQVFALTEAGRLADAERLARIGSEVAAADRVPIAQIWFALNLGRIACLQGRLATSRRYYAEGAGLAEANHFSGPRRLALAGVALACAMLGDAQSAESAQRERDTLPPFGFMGPEQQLADAWIAVVSGHLVEAAEQFRRAATAAADSGHRTTESWLLHDLLRTCDVTDNERLAALAEESDSPLVKARARHGAGRQARDPAELSASAEDFDAIGAKLLAAEAATAASDAYRRRGDVRAATAASHRAISLARLCEGAMTPGLLQISAVVALSDREREVALLAASGFSSRDIAKRLFLSVRTVENHLQRAYVKLGVKNRSEAAAALRPTL
jgi:DNA-binding CsgD family transcriptional regulator